MIFGQPGDLNDLRASAKQRLRPAILVLCGLLLFVAGVLPLQGPQQATLSALTLAAALAIDGKRRSSQRSLFLVCLSCAATWRYLCWRLLSVGRIASFHNVATNWTTLLFQLLLLCAELFFVLDILLGYMETVWPLVRPPMPLPTDLTQWPAVDVLISTFQESLHTLKYTVLAALQIDWPPDRLRVSVLDEGQREQVRIFCAEAGVGYIRCNRDVGTGGAALQSALKCLRAPFVTLFHADQVPVRAFLQMTMGWFLQDPLLSMVQTSRARSSPDPLQRSLGPLPWIADQDELSERAAQKGRDLWNATPCCGAGTVLRRSALQEAATLRSKVFARDALPTLWLQTNVGRSAYIDLPLSAAPAADRLDSLVHKQVQRTAQPLCIARALFYDGLTVPQKLCALRTSMRCFHAIPRLVFLLAPLTFLVLGRPSLPGSWTVVLAYAAPHLVLAWLVSARLYGPGRFVFWEGLTETLDAAFLLLSALPPLFAWRHAQRSAVKPSTKPPLHNGLDRRLAWPLLLLFLANAVGVCCAALRSLAIPHAEGVQRFSATRLALVVPPTMGATAGVVVLYTAWCVFNLLLLSAALGLVRQPIQRRRSVRLPTSLPVGVLFADGHLLYGTTADLSSGGVLINGDQALAAVPGEEVRVFFTVQAEQTTLPASVVEANGQQTRLRFGALTGAEEEILAMLLYAPSSNWLRPALAKCIVPRGASLLALLLLAFRSVSAALRRVFPPPDARAVALLAGLVLLCGLGGARVAPKLVRAAGATAPASPGPQSGLVVSQSADPPVRSAPHSLTLPLTQIAETPGGITLEGVRTTRALRFSVPPTEVVQRGTLRLRYRVETAGHGAVRVAIFLNGEGVGRLQSLSSRSVPAVTELEQASPQTAPLLGWHEAVLPLPPELLVEANTLEFRLQQMSACAPVRNCPGAAVRFDAASAVELRTLPIAIGPTVMAYAAPEQVSTSRRDAPGSRWLRFLGLPVLTFVCLCAVCATSSRLLREFFQERARQRLQGVL